MQQLLPFESWITFTRLVTVPLLILERSESLATVIPTLPVLETTQVGFNLWEIWLLIIGIWLLRLLRQELPGQ